MLVLAGCVTTGSTPSKTTTAPAGPPVPEALKACGRAHFSGNQLFEICGIAPEGDLTQKAMQKVYTETCGPIEVTSELKQFFCQKAEAMFNAVSPPKTQAYVAANYHDKTRVLYDSNLGNQVYYVTADGRAYFWIANEQRVLGGQWMVYRDAQICFYVPRVTEHAGTKWSCGALQSDVLVEIADGDVAELSKHKGAVPWILTAQPRITLADITQRLKSAPPQDKPGAPTPSRPVAPVGKEPMGPMVMNDY